MNEFKAQMPHLYRLANQLQRAWNTKNEKRSIDSFYRRAESQSIDYGIMEGAKNVAVVKVSYIWDDVGAWDALWRIRKPDSQGNVTQGHTISMNNRNSLLFSDQGLLTGVGLESMVVVQSGGATLVISRTQLGNIKKLIGLIRKDKESKPYLN